MAYPQRWFEAERKQLRRFAEARPRSLRGISIIDRAGKLRDDCQAHIRRDVTSATEIKEILRDVAECLAWLYYGVVNGVAPPADRHGMPTLTDIRSFVQRDLGRAWLATKLLPPRDKTAAIRYREIWLRPVLEKAIELASKYIERPDNC